MSEAGRLKKGRAEREGGAGTASPYSTGTSRPSCGCEERLFAVRSSPARSEFLKTMNSLGEVREEGGQWILPGRWLQGQPRGELASRPRGST